MGNRYEVAPTPEHASQKQAEALYNEGTRLFQAGTMHFGGIGEGSYNVHLLNRARYCADSGEIVTVTFVDSPLLSMSKIDFLPAIKAVTLSIETPLPPTGAWPNVYIDQTFMMTEKTITAPEESEEDYIAFLGVTEYSSTGHFNDQDNNALLSEMTGGEEVKATLQDGQRLSDQVAALHKRKLNELARIYPDYFESWRPCNEPEPVSGQLELLRGLTPLHEVGCEPNPYIRHG